MSKLEKGLKEWVAHGLITPDQAQRIQKHESAKPESSWILSGLLILGALIIGIGVISVIAANWNKIPDAVKLTGDFILLGGVALATAMSWESKKTIHFDVLLLFFLILCLASIGLISQIYHTGGHFYQALMFWSLITSATALAARQFIVPFLWAGAFLTGVVLTSMDSVAFQTIFNKNSYAIFMTIPLLSAGLTVASKGLAGEIASTRAFRAWTLIGGLIALELSELIWYKSTTAYDGLAPYIPGYFLAAFAALGIALSIEYRSVEKTLLLLVLGLFIIPFHFPIFDMRISIVSATFTILILGLMAIFLASLKERRLFQWFLFFLGLRFLVLYFQALGGLATTGIGLIISGGLIITMAVLWNNYRTALAVWAERWVR